MGERRPTKRRTATPVDWGKLVQTVVAVLAVLYLPVQVTVATDDVCNSATQHR
jgi:hypothetical protein